jgi:hypothetical protein
MAWCQRLRGAQVIGNGTPSNRQSGSKHQDNEALKRRPRESGRQPVQKWLRRPRNARLQSAFRTTPRAWSSANLAARSLGYLQPPPVLRYTGHASLLAQESKGVLLPSIPAKRLAFV